VVRAIGAAFTDAAIRSVQQWRYDPPADGPISFPVTVHFRAGAATVQGESRANVLGVGPISTEGALRVGGNVKTPIKIRDVRPVYPPDAQAARVSGTVILEIRVGTDGSVENAQILRSIPLLDQAAVEAVTQWRFTPTLLNGRAVPVIMTVTMNFVLEASDVVREVSPAARVEAIPAEPVITTGGIRTPRALEATEVVPERRRSPQVIKEVKPVYTIEALKAGVEGLVEMKVTIDTDGRVSDARVVRSVPMLDESALAAVRQWEFTPIPRPFVATIEMTFTKRKGR